MNKFPIYNCPDILLYDYDDDYKKLYKSKVYEFGGVLEFFDSQNKLNEAYKCLLKYNRLPQEKKQKFDEELGEIKTKLLTEVKSALDLGFKIISIADPLSSIEFLGIKAASTYLDIFLLDFLYEIKKLCLGKARIHLCPKLSILLIKTMKAEKKTFTYKNYMMEVVNKKLDKEYPSVVEALLYDTKEREIISGLKCIHFLGKTDSVAVIKLDIS